MPVFSRQMALWPAEIISKNERINMLKTKIGIILFTLFTTLFITSIVMPAEAKSSKKILVAYFSHSGNTKEIAKQIKEATGADLFEINPTKSYPSDYNTVVEQAKKEINSGYKPPLKSKVNNFASYDIIFIGSPNWWSTIAPPVTTFLSSYDFSGKTIVPFMTHEGTALGKTVENVKKICPKATVLEGLAVRGGSVKKENENVRKWLKKIKVI